jgi:hypothetical protein
MIKFFACHWTDVHDRPEARQPPKDTVAAVRIIRSPPRLELAVKITHALISLIVLENR